MSDKYLKIFNLSKDYTLDELEKEYKKLLKKLDTKNIDEHLIPIYSEEKKNIKTYYKILLNNIQIREKKNNSLNESKNKYSSTPNIKLKNKSKKSRNNKGNNILTFILIFIISVLSILFVDDIKHFNSSETDKTSLINKEKKIPDAIINKYESFNEEVKEKMKVKEKVKVKEKEKCKATNAYIFFYDKSGMNNHKKHCGDIFDDVNDLQMKSDSDDKTSDTYMKSIKISNEYKPYINEIEICKCNKCGNLSKTDNFKNLKIILEQ